MWSRNNDSRFPLFPFLSFQDLLELQLRERRICFSKDGPVPHPLRPLPAPGHLPHLLCGAHSLHLPQPSLHDGAAVSVPLLPHASLTSCPAAPSQLSCLSCPSVSLDVLGVIQGDNAGAPVAGASVPGLLGVPRCSLTPCLTGSLCLHPAQGGQSLTAEPRDQARLPDCTPVDSFIFKS